MLEIVLVFFYQDCNICPQNGPDRLSLSKCISFISELFCFEERCVTDEILYIFLLTSAANHGTFLVPKW
jgi:hypothetical protein